jgi:16S rRNA (adenine(1408)-N(1))-methyltransferase
VGSGDGRGPYRWARNAPGWLFLAADANPDALLETASRAARKPERGGVSNLLCIAEPADVLAAELAGIADRLTVILPWGSLLRAVALPEIESLRRLQRLCAPGAGIEIVFSYDEKRDAGDHGPLGHAHMSESRVRELLPLYESVGFQRLSASPISGHELQAYDTTWAKRLAFGRPRQVWRIRANSKAGTGVSGLEAGGRFARTASREEST